MNMFILINNRRRKFENKNLIFRMVLYFIKYFHHKYYVTSVETPTISQQPLSGTRRKIRSFEVVETNGAVYYLPRNSDNKPSYHITVFHLSPKLYSSFPLPSITLLFLLPDTYRPHTDHSFPFYKALHSLLSNS